jgi:hypothetical protein
MKKIFWFIILLIITSCSNNNNNNKITPIIEKTYDSIPIPYEYAEMTFDKVIYDLGGEDFWPNRFLSRYNNHTEYESTDLILNNAIHDFDTITEGEEVQVIFYFKNTGNQNLTFEGSFLGSSLESDTDSSSDVEVSFDEAESFMKDRLSNINQTLMLSGTAKWDKDTMLYMFLSVTESGMSCISSVSQYDLSVLASDCGETFSKMQDWNALNLLPSKGGLWYVFEPEYYYDSNYNYVSSDVVPGESGQIKVQFSSEGASGPIRQNLWIQTNSITGPGNKYYEIAYDNDSYSFENSTGSEKITITGFVKKN